MQHQWDLCVFFKVATMPPNQCALSWVANQKGFYWRLDAIWSNTHGPHSKTAFRSPCQKLTCERLAGEFWINVTCVTRTGLQMHRQAKKIKKKIKKKMHQPDCQKHTTETQSSSRIEEWEWTGQRVKIDRARESTCGPLSAPVCGLFSKHYHTIDTDRSFF